MLAALFHRPWWVLIAFLLLSAALATQARKFQIDASAETLLTEGNQLYLEAQQISRRYAPEEFVLVAYVPQQQALMSAASFAQIAALSKAYSELERVVAVRSILNVPLPSLAGGLQGDADPAAATVELQGYTPAQVAGAIKGHPIYEDLLINQDQSAAAIQLVMRGSDELTELQNQLLELQLQAAADGRSDELADKIEAQKQRIAPLERELASKREAEIERIREIAREFEGDAKIYLGGAHVLGYELIQIVRKDLLLFSAIIFAVIGALLMLLFRAWRWLIISLSCCTVSLLSTLGLFGALGFKATVISANFVAIQLILTLAIVIHLIVQYREYCAEQPGWDQHKLVLETVRRKLGPCFYAGITTSVGFASLLLTDIQPVISFGWMMVVAMICSIAVSLLLFPALLMLWAREPADVQPSSHALLGGVADLVDRRRATILLLSLGVLVAGALGSLRLDVENSFINYFHPSTRVHQELKFIDQQLGGSTPMDVLYTVPASQKKPDLALSADAVQTLQRIQAVMEQQPAMGKLLSVVNFTELARALNGDRPITEYELNALYFLLDEQLRDELVGSYFSEQHQQLRVSGRVIDSTEGLNRGQFLAEIRAGIAAQGVAPEQIRISGLMVLYQDLLQRLFKSQVLTLGVVFAALFIAFWAIFGSLRIALIALIPNLISSAVIFGVMGWLAIPLDFMTITIAAIAMGIAVDDTIHYVHRYLEQRENQDVQASIKASHQSVGLAMSYSTVIIAVGFSMLMFSDFVPSRIFGLLTGLAMISALLADLLLLPSLLSWTAREKTRSA